jgi:hypothetical protein
MLFLTGIGGGARRGWREAAYEAAAPFEPISRFDPNAQQIVRAWRRLLRHRRGLMAPS